MSPEEKKKMLHIRLDRSVHKDLRKAAAEYDISIQEIVSDAVEKRVEHLEAEIKLEEQRERLDEKSRKYELKITDTIEIDDDTDIEADSYLSVTGRLESIENAIGKLSEQIEEIRNLLVNHE